MRLHSIPNTSQHSDADHFYPLPLAAFRQRLESGELHRYTLPYSSVAGLSSDQTLNDGNVIIELCIHMCDDRLIQRRGVAFEGQQVVALPLDDLLRTLGLSPHRIDSHDRPDQVDQLQNLGKCCAFMGLLRGGHLGQCDPRLRRIDTHRVQRPPSPLSIMAASRRLAVYGEQPLPPPQMLAASAGEQTKATTEKIGNAEVAARCSRNQRGSGQPSVVSQKAHPEDRPGLPTEGSPPWVNTLHGDKP